MPSAQYQCHLPQIHTHQALFFHACLRVELGILDSNSCLIAKLWSKAGICGEDMA